MSVILRWAIRLGFRRISHSLPAITFPATTFFSPFYLFPSPCFFSHFEYYFVILSVAHTQPCRCNSHFYKCEKRTICGWVFAMLAHGLVSPYSHFIKCEYGDFIDRYSLYPTNFQFAGALLFLQVIFGSPVLPSKKKEAITIIAPFFK